MHPVGVGAGRVARRGEADCGDACLVEHLAVLGVVGVVEDNVDVERQQRLDVELAVVVVGGVDLKDLGGDLGGDGLLQGGHPGCAHADEVGRRAIEVGDVGRLDRDLVDGHARDCGGQGDLLVGVVGDGAGVVGAARVRCAGAGDQGGTRGRGEGGEEEALAGELHGGPSGTKG